MKMDEGATPDRRKRDRRQGDEPWKRPRTTDLRTGERVYEERREGEMKRMIEGEVEKTMLVNNPDSEWSWRLDPGIYAVVKIRGPYAPSLGARMVDMTDGNVEQPPVDQGDYWRALREEP